MARQALTTQEALIVAVQHLQAGEPDKSEHVLNGILTADDRNADALHLMAIINAQRGDTTNGIKYLEDAIAVRPNDVELLNNLGNLYKGVGAFANAYSCYKRALSIDSALSAAHFNLGRLLSCTDRVDEAVEAFRKTIELEPQLALGHVCLAAELRRQGKFKEAIAEFSKGADLDPSLFDAYFGLGNTFYELRLLEEAVAAFKQAVQINPLMPYAFNNLGVAQTELGHYADARDSLEKAIELISDFWEAKNNLAMVQTRLGEYQQACDTFFEILAHLPDSVQTLKNLAVALGECGQYRDAINFLNRVRQSDPEDYEALINLGLCHHMCGSVCEAIAIFEEAIKVNPKSFMAAFAACLCRLSSFSYFEGQFETARSEYQQKLSELEGQLDLSSPEKIQEALKAVGLVQPFNLTLQHKNNVELQRVYGQLVTRIVQSAYPHWSNQKSLRSLKADEKVRVGIVSRHFSDHCDWKIFMNGWTAELDRKQFKVFGYSTGGVKDHVTKIAQKRLDSLVEGLSFERLCERIAGDELDALIFPEIGQDQVSLQIACLKLAPVQIASWGVPQTSGLPTIDYFISSALMEPPDAQEHYVEKLVILPNLSIYYVPPKVEPEPDRLFSLGVREDAVRFLCVQSLYKYDPKYDEILARIAQRLPQAQFIFVARPEGMAGRVLSRLKSSFDSAGLLMEKHVTMLPLLSREEFSGLCSIGHVFLDSIDFSGCNTTLEAIEHNLPVVTVEGQFMRGRQSSAMLTFMEITETIANNVDSYVDIAVRLGLDMEFRNAISKKIARKSYLLYRDVEALAAFEEFLKKTCVAAN